jgi:hypothetical protein
MEVHEARPWRTVEELIETGVLVNASCQLPISLGCVIWRWRHCIHRWSKRRTGPDTCLRMRGDIWSNQRCVRSSRQHWK